MTIDNNVNSEKRILVVEDEGSLGVMLEVMLSRLGYGSDIVTTGEDAIERYSKKSYDAVIMDNQLDGYISSGIEASQEILKSYPDAKIIFMSGTSNHEAIEDHERFGFAGAMAKPIGMDYLGKTLDKILKG